METENQHRGNRFLALLKSCKRSASKNSSFTHTTKRFWVFSVCVGALFPRQRNNSAWLARAALGMLLQFECSHMARGGTDEGSDFAFLNLAIFLTVETGIDLVSECFGSLN